MFAGLAGADGAEGDQPQVARRGSGKAVTDRVVQVAVLVAYGVDGRLGARGVAFGAEDGLALGTRGQLREESGDGDASFTGLGGKAVASLDRDLIVVVRVDI